MIRPGAPADVDELRALRARLGAELRAAGREPVHGDEAWEGWIRRRLSAGDVRVGLATGRVAAYIAWEVRGSGAGGRRLDVQELYVAPEVRGQRLGSGLLARALDRGRVLGLAEAQVDRGVGDAAVAGLLGQFGFEERDGAHVRGLRISAGSEGERS